MVMVVKAQIGLTLLIWIVFLLYIIQSEGTNDFLRINKQH